MDVAGVVERVGHISAVCESADVDAAGVEAALVAVRELSGWAESRRSMLVSKLDGLSSFPESVIASSSKSSLGAASRVRDRATTLASTPKLADALADGAVTAEHVDVVTRGSRQLDETQRAELLGRVESLVDVAVAATVEQFSSRVSLEVKRIQADDGVDRLERQRRNTRLGSWVDGDGMWNLRGRFDPVTAVSISSRLDAAVEALFAESVPDGCPQDSVEKQKFLAAHALARLVAGGGTTTRPGRAEVVVVVDADASGASGPVGEWSIPVEIPARVLAELAGQSETEVVPIVVRNGVVLFAPGELQLGRTTRLASRAQRRALRGLYSGCAVPGCRVGFDRCVIHHVVWWRHGGLTDLDNLVPVCTAHHGRVHHDGWVIELGPNRKLTLRLPDGTVRATGPPGRHAA
ncbi:MAG: DUF222 domain-containing protein [Ilumatobacteraceae bacterium]